MKEEYQTLKVPTATPTRISAMETLKTLLDPYKEGVRRAVITDAGLIRDKKFEPDKDECTVLSEVCRVVFDTETRDARALIQKAYIDGLETAWNALFDDVRLGLTVPNTEMYVQHIMAHTRSTTSAKKLYVSGVLLVAHAKKTGVLKLKEPFDVHMTAKVIETFSTDPLYDDIVHVFQEVVQYTIPPIEDVADVITACPKMCALFPKHPHIDHLCTLFPNLVKVLSDAAATVPVTARQPYMVMLALMVRHGHHVNSTVAIETLTRLRSTKFHLNLAASSAIVATSASQQDPTVTALCMLVETLCTVIQKSCNIDTLEM